MLNSKPVNKVVFLDIETTTRYATLASVPQPLKTLFLKKFEKDLPALIEKEQIKERSKTLPTLGDSTGTGPIAPQDVFLNAQEELWNIKGTLHAEFNKILCISMGVIDITNPKEYKLRVKSFCGEDEASMLKDFIASPSVSTFNKTSIPDPDNAGKFKEINTKSENQFHFCAHNGLTFDFPILGKRMIYQGIELPYILDYGEKKPWDVTWFIDTKNIWKWGVFDGNVSLDLLAACFGVESSKMVMSGADVKDVYWLNKDLVAIQKYCEHDIFTLASIYLKMRGIQIPLVR